MREWLLIFALLAAGCTSPGEPVAPEITIDSLVFKMVSKERTFEECVAGSEGCTYVRLDYPVLIDAPEGYAVTAITEVVFSAVSATFTQGEDYPSVETLMSAFIDTYRELEETMPGDTHPWSLERKVFVVHNTPEVVSLSLSERTFTGGAHGSATLTFANLDPRSGDEVTLSDVLVDGHETRLLQLAEARFREVRSIEEGMSFADAGFTFENGVFALTDNVSIGADGLTFYYNPYDVAAYAVGPTEIVLSYDELGELMRR